jgi:hypothetical protein
MPPAKITCPECEAVLKVSTPGKKMKCPKCGKAFAVPRDAAGVRAAPAGGKKPAAKKPDEPTRAPAPAKKPDDEDDDGGTYALLKDPDEETAAEEDEEGKSKKSKTPEINYALDLSIKDLRGPAQAAVVGPSNLLILYGVIGFIGWLLVLFIVLIPILFPMQESAKQPIPAEGIGPALAAESDDATRPGPLGTPPLLPFAERSKQGEKREKPSPPWTMVFGLDLARLATFRAVFFIFVVLPPFFLGMAYGGAIVVGGVKMQSLQSRGWGLTASIMNMIPVHTFGLMVLLCVLVQMLLIALYDDPGLVTLILSGLMVILALIGALVGLYALKTLSRHEVIAGFEYKPD